MNSQLETAHVVASDAVVSSIATKYGMAGGALATLYGWVTSSNVAVFLGIMATVLGFIINLVYQHRRHVREEAEAEFRRTMKMAEESRQIELHQAQLAALKRTSGGE